MVQMAQPAPFSNAPTDEQIDFNRRMGARLMQQGTSTEPVGHWTQAVARALQGGLGGMYAGQAAQGERDAEASVAQALSANMDPRTLIQNPRTRAYGMNMLASQQAEGRAEARERRAEERAARDPYRQAQIGALQAEAQAKAAREQRRSALMGELLGDGGGMPAQRPPMPQTAPVAPGYDPIPQQGGPRIQPQSNLSPDVMPGGVTRVSDAPQAPQAAPQAQEPSVELFGRQVPVSRARSVGQRMLLDPETAQLGKAILDSIGPQSSNPARLQQPTLNALEERQFNTTESLSRLNSIASQFRPEFQTIENRFGYAWTNLIDKSSTARKTLKPEQIQQLAEFSAYRSDALNNLNQYIKEITGAAMTNAEAQRITRAMPNPGEGILDGDGPTEFQAKLGAAIRTSKLALARYNYIKRNGLNGQPITGPLSVNGQDTELGKQLERTLPLERMGDVIKQRKNEIGREVIMQNPQISIEQLKPVIRQRLSAEFGVDA